MQRVAIRGGHLVDPVLGIEGDADVVIEDGRVVAVGPNAAKDVRDGADTRVIDAGGLIVTPGLIDTHTHLREPGNEDEETIHSGATAAVQGGFTSLIAMPNTDPPVDNEASAAFVYLQAGKAGRANVFPAGAITRGLQGEQLSEMGQLARAGAVGFSDANHAVVDSAVLRSAFAYARMLNRPVMTHPEDPHLAAGGVMNEGHVSVELGLPGIPAMAEEIGLARDVRLADLAGSHLHVQQVTTAGAVEIIRRAKRRGVRVSAEVCTHHLCLTEECVRTFDTNYKVAPPLRTQSDIDALLEGLADGTIDVICDGHAPHSRESKGLEFLYAAAGILGLETTLGLVLTKLVHAGHLTIAQMVRVMSANPARIMGLEGRGTLAEGAIGDVTLIDLEHTWTVDRDRFVSKSRNSPYHGWELKGRAVYTIVGGKVFAREE